MKIFYYISIIFLLFGVSIFAQERGLSDINYPISELGNCSSQEECKTYCDLAENMETCLDFAEIHNLMPKDEIETAKKMLEIGKAEGPGGCQGQTECKVYCDDISHLKECVSFAEEHNLIPLEELAEAKKVIAAIDQGITAPPCKNKTDCDIYCSLSEHMEECVVFGEAAGLIPADELEDAKKVLEAIKKGAKPPPCQGKEACDVYCSQPEHIEECIAFAEAAGFISPEEALMMKETGGRGPGGCIGEEACKAYCDEPTNMKECVEFAVKYGFMSLEEAEQAKKMLEAGLTGGPGGCKGKEECDAYCNDLSHMQECIDFAVKAGFMTSEEGENAKKMAEMGGTTGPGGCKTKEGCEAYCQNPDNAQECLEFGEKMGIIKPEEKQMMEGMMMEGGPGGCKTKEECEAYCSDPEHNEECYNFGVEKGLIGPEQMPQEEIAPPAEQYGPPPEKIEPYPGEFPEGTKPPEYEYIPPKEQAPPEEIMPPQEYKEYIESPKEIVPPPSTEAPTAPAEQAPQNPQKEQAPQTILNSLQKLLGNASFILLKLLK